MPPRVSDVTVAGRACACCTCRTCCRETPCRPRMAVKSVPRENVSNQREVLSANDTSCLLCYRTSFAANPRRKPVWPAAGLPFSANHISIFHVLGHFWDRIKPDSDQRYFSHTKTYAVFVSFVYGLCLALSTAIAFLVNSWHEKQGFYEKSGSPART